MIGPWKTTGTVLVVCLAARAPRVPPPVTMTSTDLGRAADPDHRDAAGELRALEKITPANPDQKVGIEIVRNALQCPARQIAENSGTDGSIVVGKLLESKDTNYGTTRRRASSPT